MEALKEFVSRFDSVFAVDDIELGRRNMAQHVIDTQGSLPIYQRAVRVAVGIHENGQGNAG